MNDTGRKRATRRKAENWGETTVWGSDVVGISSVVVEATAYATHRETFLPLVFSAFPIRDERAKRSKERISTVAIACGACEVNCD